MLIINSASASGVAYWQRSAAYSTWLGRGAATLGLSGTVGAADLKQVLQGLPPGGGPALPTHPGLRRRHGWDLVFAAPKSVSLLALSGAEAAVEVRAAFRHAAADAFRMLEGDAAWVRRSGAEVRAHGVVAAAFEHLSNGAGQPHLHAHVVLANLGRHERGGWGCLVGRELWRWQEGLGSAFQLALRSHLNAAGFGFEWEVGRGGVAEITGVPRPERAGASARSLALRADAVWFGSSSVRAARTAQGRTRAQRAQAGPAAGGLGPAAAGALGPAEAASILARARARAALPPPPPSSTAVEKALAERSSHFGLPDLVVALAETSPQGLSVGQVNEFCQRSGTDGGMATTVQTSPRRWTTAAAQRLDRQVRDAATEGRWAHLAQVGPVVAEAELKALGISGPTAALGAHLACSGEAISVVPPGPWLAQAAAVDAARAIWQAAGMTVTVAAPTQLSERRWRALTSLRPDGWPDHRSDHGPGRSRVLVVDAADHIGPAALARLVTGAGSSATKLVLVAGGTIPGRSGASLALSFDQLVDDLAPYRLQPWLAPEAAHPAVSVRGLPVQGGLTGADSMAHLVADWRGAAATGHGPALMVAFGPAEAEALNAMARQARRAAGTLTGPEVALGERHYAVGEEVLALRRLGKVPSATRGTVVAAEPQSVTVDWRGPGPALRSHVGAEQAKSLGYGYATTVPYLRPGLERAGPGADLFVLGDPLDLGARATLVRSAWVTLAGPPAPALGPGGDDMRRRAGLAELAIGWPDHEMLERAGPRPIAASARRRWAATVAGYAVARELGVPHDLLAGPSPQVAYQPGRAPDMARPGGGPVPRLGL